MTDAIYTLDAQWRFTHINSQAAFLLQRNAEELLGKSIWEEFPEAVGSVFEQEYRRAVAEQVKVISKRFTHLSTAGLSSRLSFVFRAIGLLS
jgi:PAS domain-containing protein